MITEKPVDGFDNKLKYTKLKYPECSCGKCPKFFFNFLAVGARNTGKTFSTVQLLKHYEVNKDKIKDPDGNDYDLRYFLISPTSSANPIYQSLESLDEEDIHDTYNDKVLNSIMESIDERKKETEKYLYYKKVYKQFLKLGEEKLNKMKNTDLTLLARHDFAEPDDVYPDIRYKNPVVNVIVLDDLLGSECFSKRNQSLLKYNLIRNRHKKVCFCILSQSMKSIPKDIRMNCNLFFYGQYSNMKVIKEDLYEEVSKEFTQEQFLEMFNHINQEKYGSMIVDATTDNIKVSKGWNKLMSVE